MVAKFKKGYKTRINIVKKNISQDFKSLLFKKSFELSDFKQKI